MRTSFLRRAAAGALVAAVCWLPASARAADQFLAPAVVVAQPDGSFQYSWDFVKGPGSTTLAAAGWVGEENVPGGATGDCFCFPSCDLTEGERVTFTVSGRLELTLVEGTARNWISFCNAPNQGSITRVVPHGTTGVGDASGGGLAFWNGPNPFSTETVFHYVLPQAGDVALRIHDLSGRVVATLLQDSQPAGRHSFTWKARAGRPIPAGVLFARLHHRGRVETRSIVIVP